MTEFPFWGKHTDKDPLSAPPDDDNDAVKAVVGVLDVAKEPESQDLQQHLKTEETSEHHVTDLQNICQLLRLQRCSVCEEKEREIDVQKWTGTEKNEQINRDRQTVSVERSKVNMLGISKMLVKATVWVNMALDMHRGAAPVCECRWIFFPQSQYNE